MIAAPDDNMVWAWLIAAYARTTSGVVVGGEPKPHTADQLRYGHGTCPQHLALNLK